MPGMSFQLPGTRSLSHVRWCAALLAAGCVTCGCERATQPPAAVREVVVAAPAPEAKPYAATTGLRLNQLQVIGTHNSYHIAPDIFTYTFFDSRAVALDYTHQPMLAQLDAGIRGFELDVFVDDAGGRYAHPISIVGRWHDARFDAPGFKVLHIPDMDQESICPTLAGCLQDMAAWSALHPEHVPVFVMLECVAVDVPSLPGFDITDPERWELRHVEELDRLVQTTFGAEQLITPDRVRGSAASLREAVTTVGWPTIDELRGKFMFVITVDDHVVAKHLARHPGLRGTALFADCGDHSPDGVFCVINDPAADGKRIGEVAARGVVIRTRADENVVEPLSGSTDRQKQALASGACIVSTDFPAADPNMESGYMTCMPSGGTARIHPLANDPRAGQSIKP